MDSTIRIAELSKKEVDDILRSRKFNRVAPVSCQACGHEDIFKRRIFKIDGDYDMGDDEAQNIVRHHMKQKHNLGYIHFKVHKNTDYIDVASCSKCGSNKVAFDIELNDEIFDELAKRLNVPEDKIQSDVQAILKRIS
ncbi:MAG: hypothetical protein LWX02_06330 [Deltaproteobacteria bacterium]|nr:hypothetical protein [Deltaproteobacteria bacterium]